MALDLLSLLGLSGALPAADAAMSPMAGMTATPPSDTSSAYAAPAQAPTPSLLQSSSSSPSSSPSMIPYVAPSQSATPSMMPQQMASSQPDTSTQAAPQGLLGRAFDFSDPRVAASWAMISNGLTPSKTPVGLTQGVGEAVANANQARMYQQKMQDDKDAKSKLANAQNQTYQFLVQKSPELAAAVQSGALTPSDAWGEYLKRQDPAYGLDIQYKQAQINKLNRKADGSDETYFGNPVAVTNPDGSISYGQIGNKGTFHPIQLAPGQSFAPPTKQIDTGTEIIQTDQAGNVISRTPKQNETAAQQKELGSGQGKSQADAQAALPLAESSAALILDTINGIQSDPETKNMVGPINSRLPNMSGASQRVQSRIDQLHGQAFLQAYTQLRGSGAITDIEGTKGTAAIARLNEAQTFEDYNAALNDLKDVVQKGLTSARQKAAGNFTQQQPASAAPAPSSGAAPAGPSVDDLVKKYGG